MTSPHTHKRETRAMAISINIDDYMEHRSNGIFGFHHENLTQSLMRVRRDICMHAYAKMKDMLTVSKYDDCYAG